jgi:hypothetical protein
LITTDENSETVEDQKISAMPTFKFFANGKPFGKDLVGADEKDYTTHLKT